MYPSRKYRGSDPLVCQHLWDAITIIRNHKQLPSFDRIRRYMTRTHNMTVSDIEKHLEESATDNLIAITRKVGQKGSKVGVEQEGFRLPVPPDEPSRHDWYCFECHQGGLVVSCSKCYRVYHDRCIPPHVMQQSSLIHQQQLLQLQQQQQMLSQNIEPQFVCGVCQKRMVARAAAKAGLSREELNTLLAYTVNRLRDKLPVNLLERIVAPVGQKPLPNNPNSSAAPNKDASLSDTSQTSACPSAPSNSSTSSAISTSGATMQANIGSEPWRAQLLLHHHMDLYTMERKTHDNRYRTAADLEIDAMTIVHNVVIYHGAKSPVSESSLQFLRDCQHCLLELQLCADCYRWQHCREDPLWFCKPCNPRHRLVYAKQKGFPYWPAKVIREGPNSCDVRFFGNQHQRANIDNEHIKPITYNVDAFQNKKTTAYLKAQEELKMHQDILNSSEGGNIPPSVPSSTPPSNVPSKVIQAPSVPVHPPPTPKSNVIEKTPSTHESPSKSAKLQESKKVIEERVKVDVPVPMETASGNEPQVQVSPKKTPVKSTVSSTSKSSHPVVSAPSSSSRDDVVSSSSQEPLKRSLAVQTSQHLLQAALEELEAESLSNAKESARDGKLSPLQMIMEQIRSEVSTHPKHRSVSVALKKLEREFERVRDECRAKTVTLEGTHRQQIKETKRKQWCWSCESEAIYHCCWNTAYCSTDCQQQHWHKEHKRLCRRKQ